jgi:hypothetical protein
VDVTSALKAGANQLEIKVTNEWTNRQVGDRQGPPDKRILTSDAPAPRGGGAPAAAPAAAGAAGGRAGAPPAGGRSGAGGGNGVFGGLQVLNESGLLGPVTLVSQTTN